MKLHFGKRRAAKTPAPEPEKPEVPDVWHDGDAAFDAEVFGAESAGYSANSARPDIEPPAPGFKRVAAIDCGTNTIRLLIADVDHDGNLSEVLRRVEIVRLGEGVDQTGVLSDEALARTFAVTREFAQLIRDYGAVQGRFVATSATRDAANSDQFANGIARLIGAAPEVITGDEEATYAFAGATRTAREIGAPSPYLVVDIGGGSTELVLGNNEPYQAVSLNIGSVRLTERCLHSDPPEPRELADANATVTRELLKAETELDLHRVRTLIGVAGSITTIAAYALGLEEYDREAINGAQIPVSDVLTASVNLLHERVEDRAALGIMQSGREDVIGAGALIWAQIIARVGRDMKAMGSELETVMISESDLLDGLALSMA